VTLREVVIDKEVLNAFKGRASRAFPLEYAEVLWGYIEDDVAFICVLDRVSVAEAELEGIEYDSLVDYGETDPKTGLVALGSIHTHPQDISDDPELVIVCEPSDQDLSSVAEEQEMLFGILTLKRLNDRRLTSLCFFLPDGSPLEVSVSEVGNILGTKHAI